jgi:PAS domain S-box-containing protein
VTVVVVLWLGDSVVRAFLLHQSSFARQVFAPPVDVLLARLPLMALGVVILLSLRGIRQLEAARDEAYAERRRLQELYDYSTDAITLLDRELRVVFMNKAAERIGGTRLTDAVGWHCYACILGLDEPCKGCRAREVFDTAKPQSATKYEVTGSGQENWLEQTWYPVLDGRGNVEGVLEIAHDITDRKLLEREVAECHRSLDARRREAQ